MFLCEAIAKVQTINIHIKKKKYIYMYFSKILLIRKGYNSALFGEQ